MIEVTVKTLDASNHQFTVSDQLTVRQFKEEISSTVTIQAAEQRLIFRGRVLQDDKKLSEYNVANNTIHLVQRPANSGTQNDEPPRPSVNADFGLDGGEAGIIITATGNPADRNAIIVGTIGVPSTFDIPSANTEVPAAVSGQRRNGAQIRLVTGSDMVTRASNLLQTLEEDDEVANITQQQSDSSSESDLSESDATPTQQQVPHFQIPENRPNPQATGTGESHGGMDIDGHGPISLGRIIAQAANAASEAAVLNSLRALYPNATGGVIPVNASNVSQSGSQRTQQQSQGDSAGNNSSNSSAGQPSGNSATPNLGGIAVEGGTYNRRAEAPRLRDMAVALQDLLALHERLTPFLQFLMSVLRENRDHPIETGERRSIQYTFDTVSQILHCLGHSYHAYSDLMCDFGVIPQNRRISAPSTIFVEQQTFVRATIPVAIPAFGAVAHAMQNPQQQTQTGQHPLLQQQQPASQGQQPASQGQQSASQGQQPASQGQQSASQGQQQQGTQNQPNMRPHRLYDFLAGFGGVPQVVQNPQQQAGSQQPQPPQQPQSNMQSQQQPHSGAPNVPQMRIPRLSDLVGGTPPPNSGSGAATNEARGGVGGVPAGGFSINIQSNGMPDLAAILGPALAGAMGSGGGAGAGSLLLNLGGMQSGQASSRQNHTAPNQQQQSQQQTGATRATVSNTSASSTTNQPQPSSNSSSGGTSANTAHRSPLHFRPDPRRAHPFDFILNCHSHHFNRAVRRRPLDLQEHIGLARNYVSANARQSSDPDWVEGLIDIIRYSSWLESLLPQMKDLVQNYLMRGRDMKNSQHVKTCAKGLARKLVPFFLAFVNQIAKKDDKVEYNETFAELCTSFYFKFLMLVVNSGQFRFRSDVLLLWEESISKLFAIFRLCFPRNTRVPEIFAKTFVETYLAGTPLTFRLYTGGRMTEMFTSFAAEADYVKMSAEKAGVVFIAGEKDGGLTEEFATPSASCENLSKDSIIENVLTRGGEEAGTSTSKFPQASSATSVTEAMDTDIDELVDQIASPLSPPILRNQRPQASSMSDDPLADIPADWKKTVRHDMRRQLGMPEQQPPSPGFNSLFPRKK